MAKDSVKLNGVPIDDMSGNEFGYKPNSSDYNIDKSISSTESNTYSKMDSFVDNSLSDVDAMIKDHFIKKEQAVTSASHTDFLSIKAIFCLISLILFVTNIFSRMVFWSFFSPVFMFGFVTYHMAKKMEKPVAEKKYGIKGLSKAEINIRRISKIVYIGTVVLNCMLIGFMVLLFIRQWTEVLPSGTFLGDFLDFIQSMIPFKILG